MSEQISVTSHPDFSSTLDALLQSLFHKTLGVKGQSLSISKEKIRKATWLSSIAAMGESDQDKNLASTFGSLLYLYDKTNESYKKACYVMQSRTGNLITTKHLPKIFTTGQYDVDFGSLLNLELTANREVLSQSFSDETQVVFTTFQKELWHSLTLKKNVAISAPTSSGKSFIIKKYIAEIIQNDSKDIIYVVPTKALINQVSHEIKLQLGDKAHVLTTFKEIDDDIPSVFVLTPERCLKIFQSKSFAQPALIFVDEVHNLEDSSRGSVFENALYRMMKNWTCCQLVVAGPFIQDLSNSIRSIINTELIDHKTLSSPVFQLKIAITFLPRQKKAEYLIASPTGNRLKGVVDTKVAIYSKAKSNKGDALAAIMELFNSKDHNIIYSPTKGTAEKWAKKIAPVIGSNNPEIVNRADQRVIDLIEFLSDEVHPKYSLIRTLRLGVAFHHAGLPDLARQEIEELYSESVIRNIVCTSTLIQGVNLPADRLIVIRPSVHNTPLSDFEFSNLIGRAGRANSKLYGEIYCLDIKDEPWGEERITNQVKKTVSSSTINNINKSEGVIEEVIAKTKKNSEILKEDKELATVVSYLRTLFLVDRPHFEHVIAQTNVDKQSVDNLKAQLTECTGSLLVPSDIVSQNPFIDPLLQNQLYCRIKQEGLSKWLISRKPNSKNGVNDHQAEFESQSYYYQFWSLMIRLNEIFDIEHEINHKANSYQYVNIGLIVKDCNSWMNGKKHRHFINATLPSDSSDFESDVDEAEIDRVAKYVTNHLSRNITFITVKYLMVWADIIASFMSDEQKEEHAYILNLPSMLEMGSYDPIVLEIMILGINRSIALKIRRRLTPNIDVETQLNTLDISTFPPLYKRYLERSGYGIKANE